MLSCCSKLPMSSNQGVREVMQGHHGLNIERQQGIDDFVVMGNGFFIEATGFAQSGSIPN